MKTVGFVVSHKNNEKRRALLPKDMHMIKNLHACYIEEGYGHALGIEDSEYVKSGGQVVPRDEVLKQDIIVDVMLGDADYLEMIDDNKILFGWAHAVQNLNFTTSVIAHHHTVVAWEELYEYGRYLLWRNREIAGEAAILQAYQYCGKMPYETKVAVIGNGQTAKGAIRFLNGLGAEVEVYPHKHEELFKKNMYNYDILVNCVLWDTSRQDRLIYRSDLKKMKKGTMIIDISCDPNLEIETSRATTIDNPVYVVDNVIHYAVDNTPAMYPHTVTKILSEKISPLIDQLIEENWGKMIKSAMVIKNGIIIDERITKFRENRMV